MLNKLLVFILGFTIAFAPFRAMGAVCPNPVTLLNEGAASPCRGYLFSEAEEFKMFKLNEDHRLLQVQFDTQNKIVEDQKKQLIDLSGVATLEQQKSDLWRVKAENSTKDLIEVKEGQGRRDLLFIGLGILLTVASGFAIGAASKAFK